MSLRFRNASGYVPQPWLFQIPSGQHHSDQPLATPYANDGYPNARSLYPEIRTDGGFWIVALQHRRAFKNTSTRRVESVLSQKSPMF
ncbi:hypothetical protein L596_017088 [Steinernema carpocapsae]|uniref:Uncharacterized protein n=1 Tax=Steinernema carpocapsae TaxID=34508 RepID=A0A4U5N1A8_STECR|nr:hypothetical protein L596_017088 [Steinernema carpocapsae]